MMSDLDWLQIRQNMLIIFKNGHMVLSREARSHGDAVGLFEIIGDRWSRPMPNLDPLLYPAMPFHVLFHVPVGAKFENIPSVEFAGTDFS
jgi:hypothetical protein